MNVVMQVCVVICTLAVVALAIIGIRLMSRMMKITDDVQEAAASLNTFIGEARQATTQVRELTEKVTTVTQSVQGVTDRFVELGHRTSAITSSVIDEVERPVRQASALVHGLRAGANVLLQRWVRRGQSQQQNGGYHHV